MDLTFEQRRDLLAELCPEAWTVPGFDEALTDVFRATALPGAGNGSLAPGKGTLCQCLSKVAAVLPPCVANLADQMAARMEPEGSADAQAVYTALLRATRDVQDWMDAHPPVEPREAEA